MSTRWDFTQGMGAYCSFTWHRLTPLLFTSKIGHVTCDNASNNSTMMEEFAARLMASTGKRYKWRKRKIKSVLNVFTGLFPLFTSSCSCLAHVINLATQALIAAYSKSPHFDPKNPEAHIPTSRDEVGLVRAIVVKVQYSIFYLRMRTVGHNRLFRNVLLQNANKSGIWFRSRISLSRFNSSST